MRTRLQLGQLLKQAGLIEDRHVRSALGYQQHWGIRFGRALVELQVVTETQIVAALGHQLGLPVVRLAEHPPTPEALSLVPEKLIRQRRVLPIAVQQVGRGRRLIVAFCTPEDLRLQDEVAFAAGMEVVPVLAGETDVEESIARALDGAVPGLAAEPGAEMAALLQHRTEIPVARSTGRRDALELPPEPSGEFQLDRGRHEWS